VIDSMHAISRTAFLTFGTSFLVLMVFLGAALHFDIFPLQQISEIIAQFSFIGYSIPELIGLGMVGSYSELTYALKMFFLIAGLFVSIFTIGISFLPSVRLQLKVLSLGLSIPSFIILFNFWIYFISDDRDILREDKIMLYLVTIIIYSFSVTLMWYGLHVRRVSAPVTPPNEINPMRSHMIQKSIPTAEELSKDMVMKTQSNQSTEIEVSTVEVEPNNPQESLNDLPEAKEIDEVSLPNSSSNTETVAISEEQEDGSLNGAVDSSEVASEEETLSSEKLDHPPLGQEDKGMEKEAS
jgi:hypothetical protein